MKNSLLLSFLVFVLSLSIEPPPSFGAESASAEGKGSVYVLHGGGGLSEQQRYDLRKASILGLASVELPSTVVQAARGTSGYGAVEGKRNG